MMMRSKWKNIFVDVKLLNILSNLADFSNKQFIRVNSRRIRLFIGFLGKKLSIYNGRKNVVVFIRNGMFGRYLGSYILTKRFSSNIHNIGGKRKDGKL